LIAFRKCYITIALGDIEFTSFGKILTFKNLMEDHGSKTAQAKSETNKLDMVTASVI
jgi:hypothetical protein